MKVFLGGEGPNDIGDWYGYPYHQGERPRHGVVGILLQKVNGEGWEVGGAVAWKRLRKLRVGQHGKAEVRNVQALMLKAREAGCDVVAFVRDRDRDRDRQRTVEQGIAQAAQRYPDGPQIVGGMAIEKLESWIVAMSGKSGSESMREQRLRTTLAQLGLDWKSTGQYADFAEAAELEQLPGDARSLQAWLKQAAEALDQPKAES